ncbi:MAG: hypothetical protein V1917_01610 [Candidatus Gottesmanbacteria bacterium]
MKKSTLLLIIIISVILIIAAVPRSVEVFSQNFIFGYDQGKHWLAAKSIVIDHKFPLIGDEVGGARGFFQGSGWFYLLAVPFLLFQGNPYGGIVLMFLIGMMMVIGALWLFARNFGVKKALVIGLCFALSPVFIEISRFAWPPYVIPPLMVVYLYCVYRIIKAEYIYIPILSFVVGMMAHFEIATAGTLLITTICMGLPYILWKKVPFRYIAWSGLAFIIPLTPLIIFDLRHDFLNIRGVIATFFGPSQNGLPRSDMTHTFANHWLIFSSDFFRAFQVKYLTKIGSLVVLLLGIPLLWNKRIEKHERTFVAFLYAFPAVLFIVLMAYRNDLWGWWILELPVVSCILLGLVLSNMWTRKQIVWRIIVVAAIALMFAGYLRSAINFWDYDYKDYGGTHKMRGKSDAIDFIFSDAKSKNFGLFVFAPPIYTYPYDFILWWKGRMYGYQPPQEKKQTYYLLAEPDPEKPWTYKGWMETAVTGGTDIQTWTLPSGFIVVKRSMP